MSPPVVEVLSIIVKNLPQYSEWVATTDGYVNAVIRPQVQGYLIKQNYKEGSFVKRGQILFEIDPRPFEAALDQALGQLNRAKSQFITDSINLQRIQFLAPQNAVSMRDLDNALASEHGSRNAVLSELALVKMARLNIEFTKIKSPISGIAGIALAQEGDLVGPSMAAELTTVSIVDPVQVNFFASERQYLELFSSKDSTHLALNQMIFELQTSGSSIDYTKGKFYAIDRQIDQKTGTIKMEALFANPGNILRPGQFVRIRVITKIKQGALLVPQRAVSEIQGKTMIAVVNDSNRIELRMITTGISYESLIEIVKGVRQGELVVVEGIQKAIPGMQVNPKLFVSDSSELGKKNNVPDTVQSKGK